MAARRRFRWDRLAVVGCAVHLVAGLLFSPLTSPRSVRIAGAGPGVDREAMAKRLDGLRGRAWSPQLEWDARSALLGDPWVASAAWSSNPFGRARARLETRVPVAVSKASVLTADGKWLPRRPGVGLGLPEVRLPASALGVAAGLAGTGDGPRLADTVRRAQDAVPGLAILELDELGVLSLRWKAGHRAVLGSWQRLDDKLAAAARILGGKKEPDSRTLVLVAPESPVWSAPGG